MADWRGLPGGVVALIAKRIQVIEDFIAFRATCSSWRKAATLNDFDKSCPRLPLLMLRHSEYNVNHEIDENNEDYEIDEVDENIQIHEDSDEENSEIDENYEIIESDENNENDEIDESDGNEENSETDENYEVDEIEENNETFQRKNDMDEIVQRKDSEANHEVFSEVNPKRHESFPESNHECKFLRKDPEANPKCHPESKFLSVLRRKGPEVNHERKFFSLPKGKGCMISLPEASGMECIGSKGWLIMVERSTGNMCVFHPLTRARIPLPKAPPQVTFPNLPKRIRSAVLSASPSETSDYVVMVAYVEPHYISGSYVVFWKPGNPTWTRVETPPCVEGVEDLNYYNGKFYALTWSAEVWMCDVSGPNANNKATIVIELPWKWSRPGAQLVECRGRLLIVAPFFCYHYDLESHHDLKMVELDVIKGSYSTITSLGSSTVFLGRNEGFSIDANKFPGIIEPNIIYFSDGSYRVATRGRNHVPRPRLGWGRGVWINF